MIFIIILWYLIGVVGFVFWWTRKWDLTTSEIPIALMAGFIGPCAWGFGWAIHWHKHVIIKARKSYRLDNGLHPWRRGD